MRALLAIGIAAALLAAGKPRTACELLSAAEIATSLGAPAGRIDSINSGTNETTHVDYCSWYVKEGASEGVMVKLRRAPSAGDAPTAMLAARIDEGISGDEATLVAGVGEEAQYLPYPDEGRDHHRAPGPERGDAYRLGVEAGAGAHGQDGSAEAVTVVGTAGPAVTHLQSLPAPWTVPTQSWEMP